MKNEHTFALFGAPGTSSNTGMDRPSGPEHVVDPRITAALSELQQARIRPMSRDQADRTLGVLGRIQSMTASLMCDVTRRVTDARSDDERAEMLRQGTRMPTRESKRMGKTAKRLSEMPKVKERFAAGHITRNHADALASAAEKVGPQTVEADPGLLEAAGRMPADTFGRHARQWSEKKLIEAGVDPLERQRRAREAKMWVDRDTGLGILMAKVPRPQYEHLRQAVDGHYLRLHRRDSAGNRDPDAVRTPKQRLADAVFELLTNRSALSGESITDRIGANAKTKAKASTQLVVTAPIGMVDGTERGGQAQIVGAGPVPRRFLEELTPDTELAAMLCDRMGRPLWLGRNQRLGNAAQRLAVAVRDGGCFECGAPMHRCELHHIREWRRDRGPTDIDNLVAVCRRHHKWLETNNLVVRRTGDGQYRTQPRDGPYPP